MSEFKFLFPGINHQYHLKRKEKYFPQLNEYHIKHHYFPFHAQLIMFITSYGDDADAETVENK